MKALMCWRVNGNDLSPEEMATADFVFMVDRASFENCVLVVKDNEGENGRYITKTELNKILNERR